MNYLSFDVGTTACKCQLFSQDGAILEYFSKEYGFADDHGVRCVDIEALTDSVFSMIRAVTGKHRVDSVCFSTFGETFVLLDENDKVLCPPMLYTDERGEEEAKLLTDLFAEEYLYAKTGTLPHAMYSVSKLMWLKKHRPEIFARAKKAPLICDYLGYLLTGKRVIDYSLAARTGAFDIRELRFCTEILERVGIDPGLFSTPERTGAVVAEIDRADLGLDGCKLVLGSHDQICTALGAGITKENEAVDGMGTVECITVVYEGAKGDVRMGREGYCCMPYAIGGLYCSLVVTYACSSIINWFRNELLHGYKGGEENIYAYLEKRMSDEPGSLLMLPYFAGSMIPYQDLHAKGALVGLTTSTTDGEIYRAIMEGLAMEMKLEVENARKYGISVDRAVATGGGARSGKWLKIKADVQGIPYETVRSGEGGLCGCAILQAAAVGGMRTEEAAALFVKKERIFLPDDESSAAYAKNYRKYVKLYGAIKSIENEGEQKLCLLR